MRFWDAVHSLFEKGKEAVSRLLHLGSRSISEAETTAQAVDTALINGLPLDAWQATMRQQIKDEYIRQYVIARGGVENMAQADWGSIGGMLADQYRYLDRFAADIASGNLSAAQIEKRAAMYIRSAREAFWRGTARAQGWPPLPAYPGDGSTRCLTNCQCSWDVLEVEGAWLATWQLGAAEHCEDCIQRAREWSPLVIEK